MSRKSSLARPSSSPAEDLQRTETLTFEFDGRKIQAYPGDTIASALHAAGIRILSRSFKYHRPRGLFCVSGNCPNCLVEVNDEPSVRSCMTPVCQGMVVRGQNAWPSVDRDILSMADRFSGFLPPGFYYKRFHKPRWMWPIYEKVLRRIAGLGKLRLQNDKRDPQHGGDNGWEKEYHTADLTIVGAGPAGIAAAQEAARLGISVVLIDEGTRPGGHLRAITRPLRKPLEWAGHPGWEVAEQMVVELEKYSNVSIWTGATAFGVYEDNLVGVLKGSRFIQLRTQHLLLATGSIEQPYLFHNNDLPGIFLGRGARKLLNVQGVFPGRRVIVFGSHLESLSIACELLDAGVQVVGVVGVACNISPDNPDLLYLKAEHVPIYPDWILAEAMGKKCVEAARIIRTSSIHVSGPEEQILHCDAILVSVGFAPASDLVLMSGGKARFNHPSGEPVPTDLPPGVSMAGEVNGIHGLDVVLLEGKIAGLEAGLSLGIEDASATRKLEVFRNELNVVNPLPTVFCDTPTETGQNKRFVCLCEDVTEKDVGACIEEGYDNIETLKRYSTIGMGPCQGKVCNVTASRIFSRETALDSQKIRMTTSRPPYRPVPLGALAGRMYQPIRRTPMHTCHEIAGAKWMDAGDWKRPEWYSSPDQECRVVHEGVGLIDVSTLGKLDIQGRDAVWLLEKVYSNQYQKLKIGRVRYGVMCDDAGIIFDDGTVSRLAEDRFFVTTTTSGIDAVEQWMEWWILGTGRDVFVTNVSAAYAAMNLAGPKAREVLSQITDIDLSTEELPYMAFAEGEMAGVSVRLLRIGFVGELGYEIHCPAEHGEFLWNAVMDAGRPHGIQAFGVEAQRILRLQKGHIIVGQDTDALSNPFEADMPWVVKLNKQDFIGRHTLEGVQDRGCRLKLIGFEMVNPSVVAEEGDQIIAVDGSGNLTGRILGRVTSSRRSEFLKKSIGLGWIPIELSEPGSEIWIRIKEKPQRALVTQPPFYDKDGDRLKL